MKKDGQKIYDHASETPVEMCNRILKEMEKIIIVSIVLLAILSAFAYMGKLTNKLISNIPVCEPQEKVLTLSSSIFVRRVDGKAIEMSLSEFADYAIEQHWQNTMIEEEARP